MLVVLAREADLQLDCGLRILIDSRVPEGKGVSSSAALEVATMQAIAAPRRIDASRVPSSPGSVRWPRTSWWVHRAGSWTR